MKYRLLLFGVVTCAVAYAIFIFSAEHQYRQTKHELDAFTFPSHEEGSFSRKEASLYRYVIAARIDPIFALPGVDIQNLRVAIEALEVSRNEFLDSFEPHEQKLLRDTLYPLDFLEKLSQSENTRRTFIDDPSYASARAYHEAIKAALSAYKENVRDFTRIVRTFDDRTLGFWDGTTNPRHIAGILEEAASEASRRSREESLRFMCLSYGFPCPSLLQAQGATMPDYENEAGDTLPPAIERNLAIVDGRADRPAQTLTQWGEEWHARTARVLDEDPPSPLSALPVALHRDSHCTLDGESAYVRFWWSNSRASDIPTERLSLVNDLYFHDVESAQSDFEQELKALGVLYMYQPLNPFVCIDYGNDSAAIFTARAIQRSLQNHSLFIDREPDGELLERLRELEGAIRESQDVLSTHTVDVFIGLLESLLLSGENPPLHTLIGRESALQAEQLITLWKSKSAGFEHLVGYADDENVTTRLLAQYRDLTLEELFLIRSYASILFQLSNETIVSSEKSLIEAPRSFEPADLRLISYNETLHALYTPHEMLNLIIEGDTAVNNLKQ